MPLRSSRLPGGLGWGDIQGGFWDALGILQTAWRAVCGVTSREDPRIPLVSPRLPGGLGVGGQPGRSLGSSGQHGGLCVRTSRDNPVMSSK